MFCSWEAQIQFLNVNGNITYLIHFATFFLSACSIMLMTTSTFNYWYVQCLLSYCTHMYVKLNFPDLYNNVDKKCMHASTIAKR